MFDGGYGDLVLPVVSEEDAVVAAAKAKSVQGWP